MFLRYAFVFGIYINLDVFYSIWTYTKYNNSLEILITAYMSIICQYWWIFLDFVTYYSISLLKYNSFSSFLLEIYFNFNIMPYTQIHNEYHFQTSLLISVGEIYVIIKRKNTHKFTFDRFGSIVLKILKYLLFPKIVY